MGAILNGEVGFMHLELWLRLHQRRWIGEGEKSLRTTVRQYLAGGGGVSQKWMVWLIVLVLGSKGRKSY